jgi:hypothetical protein
MPLIISSYAHAALCDAGCEADKYGDPNVAVAPTGCFVCPVGSSRPGFTTAETFQCGGCNSGQVMATNAAHIPSNHGTHNVLYATMSKEELQTKRMLVDNPRPSTRGQTA